MPYKDQAPEDIVARKKKMAALKKMPLIDRCVGCGASREIQNPTQMYCQRCNLCGNCSSRASVDEVPYLHRCKWCRCQDCGSGGDHLIQDVATTESRRDSVAFMLCTSCYTKKHPDSLCVKCNKEVGRYFVRTGKKTLKPNYCSHCIRNIKEAPCYFCKTVVTTKVAKNGHAAGTFKGYTSQESGMFRELTYYVCRTCAETHSCLRDGCTPVRPCEKCLLWSDDHGSSHLSQQASFYGDANFYFQQEPIFHPVLSVKDRKENRSIRLLGTEIEVAGLRVYKEKLHVVGPGCNCIHCSALERTRLHNYVKGIGGSILSDESLPLGGFEITMPPAGGDIFMRQIEDVSDILHGMNAYVSEKCGLHIHMDARDFTTQDIRKLLMLWVKTEPAFLYTQDAKRIYKSKSHCFPTAEKFRKLLIAPELLHSMNGKSHNWSAISRDQLNNVVYDKEWPRPPRLMRGNNRTITARYDDLNVHSWLFRGTIECRLHAGTINYKSIQNWGIILASLMDAAVRMTEREVLELPANEPKSVLLSIIPSMTHPYLFNRWDVFEATHKGKEKYFH